MPLTKVIPVMLENGPLTGSLFGTASFALTASYAANGGGTALTTGSTYQVTSSWANNAVSSSYALTASYASNIPATSSWSTQAQTASYVANAISASYALTASYSLNGGGGGTASLLTGQTFYVTTPSTAFSLSQVVVDEDQVLVMLNGLMQSRTSSYTVSSSTLTFTSTIPSGALVDVRFLNANNMAGPAVSSSYAATASYVINGVTASYVATAQTASYVTLAQTASYVLLAQTASYVLNAISASYSLTSSWSIQSQTASFVTLAQTASYILTASYALKALSASYAPNIYVLPSNVVSASAQLSNGGGTAFSNSNNLTVGQVTASAISVTTLSVVTVTSSIDYASGSNIFGTKSTDTQLFTGSVNMSGSLSVVGNITSNNVLSLASGTVSLPSLILSTDTTSGMYRIGANNIGISISAAKVLDISSTGLSVTGALSATGASTIQNTLTITRSSATARTLTLSLENGTADYITDATGAYPHRFFVGATKYAQIDTTGLAVTGQIDTTSTFRAVAGGGGVSQLNFVGNTGNLNAQIQYDQVAANTGQIFIGTNNAGTFATRLTITSTGLAVTGALSSTTASTLCSTSGTLTVGSNTAVTGGIIVNTLGTTGNMPYLNFKVAGTQYGLVALTGALAGTTATDMCIFAETGKTINLWPNGGTTGTIVSSTGLAVTGAVSLTTTLSITNSSTSADVMLSRPSTALGATLQYKTGATLNWYHGTRGLSDNNWYLFNNNLSTNTLIISYADNTATFAGSITMGGWPIIGNDGNATYAFQSAAAITAYTAGASVGTLNNAPSAGNPTKWITINDNGTLRRIPTW